MNANDTTNNQHAATAAEAEATSGPTNGQQGCSKARAQADWQALLREALTQPGRVSEAYSRFHSYSIGNALWVLGQCYVRGIQLGPIATFNQWKENGRMVKKGEHALAMCMPVTVHGKKQEADTDDEESTTDTSKPHTIFIAKRNWFVLAQTDTIEDEVQREPQQEPAPRFDAMRAAKNLGFSVVPFDSMDGNVQGYSLPDAGIITINPLAIDPVKTTIHECAHCLLHTSEPEFRDRLEPDRGIKEVEAEGAAYVVCASIGKTGSLDSMRGYIQSWLSHADGEFTQKNARRIFAAAAKILRAGAVRQGAA